jgi:hypothetical protein
MHKYQRDIVKGHLEVKVIQATNLGLSDKLIPVGSIGYVLGRHPTAPEYLVYFPSTKEHGSIQKVDVIPTGQRG